MTWSAGSTPTTATSRARCSTWAAPSRPTRAPRWATGYCRIIDGDGREIRKPITAYKNLLLRHWSYPLYLTQNFVSDPATFVRRTALEEAGPLDPRYRISHDYDLWLRVGRRHRPVVLRRTLSNFRMVEGTLSMAGFESQFAEHADCARRWGDGHRLRGDSQRADQQGDRGGVPRAANGAAGARGVSPTQQLISFEGRKGSPGTRSGWPWPIDQRHAEGKRRLPWTALSASPRPRQPPACASPVTGS